MMPMTALNFLSPDGKSYAFDSRANGYGRGEGIGIVVLKRLSDAIQDNDNIRAVIRGSRVNQDGRTPGKPLTEYRNMKYAATHLQQVLPFQVPKRKFETSAVFTNGQAWTRTRRLTLNVMELELKLEMSENSEPSLLHSANSGPKLNLYMLGR
jgi:3-oxoacyl-(acyl-carrier-protein) synthase